MTDTAQCAKCAFKIDLPHTDMMEIFYKNHDCEVTELQSAIQRVRELHRKDLSGDCSACVIDAQYGAKMYENYPCPTIKALDGEQ
jgi:hypothetical protein